MPGEDVGLRLVEIDDAAAPAELLQSNREFLAPWDPVRDDAYFTQERQRVELELVLVRHERGLVVPLLITLEGRLVGRINVNDVVRGAFQSAHLGYWVAQAVNGQGVATAAVAAAVRLAFTELGLHRLQADTHSTAPPRSGCWHATASPASAWRRSTCASPAAGRTTCSTSA